MLRRLTLLYVKLTVFVKGFNMKKLLLIAMLAVLPVLSGCSTVRALGRGVRDIGNIAGNVIEATSEDAEGVIIACAKDMQR